MCTLSSTGTVNSCAQNIGVVTTKGWEASVKYAVVKDIPLVKSLDVQAQYTNTLTRNLSQQPGNRAPRTPVDQWSLIVSYQPIDPVRVNLKGDTSGRGSTTSIISSGCGRSMSGISPRPTM